MNKLNYPNWLVPLYIAKELREIGFREKTFTYFEINTDGEDRYFTPTDINFKELQIYNRYRDYVSIPTWEQVFEWFRERGLHSSIRYLICPVTYSYHIIDNCNWNKGCGYRDTYEEAREALVYKLIEIYKSEQK